MPNSRWQIYPAQDLISHKLAAKLGRHPIVAQILLNRQIRSLKQAKLFLDSADLQVNTLNIDAQKAAINIFKEMLSGKKKALVYGDYDVDGITSTVIMLSFLNYLGIKADFHIPDRFNEGYGINYQIIEQYAEKNYDLLLTLDCGISNKKEISRLKELSPKTKVIIMDHHTIPGVLPPAETIINPKLLNTDHPLYNICTAGIVYKFIEYYISQEKLTLDQRQYLDLVAMATVADVAPLLAENRKLTKLGLKTLSSRSRKSIKLLLDAAGFKKQNITVRDIGFTIAPRLNAAGRLAHAKIGVEFLLNENDQTTAEIAFKLQQINTKRQQLCSLLFQEIEEMLSQSPAILKNKMLVLSGENWHTGIIGIVAAQLVRKYCRAVVLIARTKKSGIASARTFGQINIYELLKSCDQYFSKFGGHKEAAGFSIPVAKIPEFQTELNKIANERISELDMKAVIDIDCKLEPESINFELLRQIQELEPFGQGNPAPIFYTNNLNSVDFRRVGNGAHLKATFIDKKGQNVFDGIGFGLGDKLNVLYKDNIELAFTLEENIWDGKNSIQLQIVDLR